MKNRNQCWKCGAVLEYKLTQMLNYRKFVWIFYHLLLYSTWQLVQFRLMFLHLYCLCKHTVHLSIYLSLCNSFLSASGSLSLSYLLGRRQWRSPWPSWPEPWPAPAEWGRSSLPPPARSGTSGSEMHTLREQTQERRKI